MSKQSHSEAPIRFVAIVLVAFGILAQAAQAETLVGSNVDERVLVALRVQENVAQEWLPAPWLVGPPPKGPFKDANLFVVFIDRLLSQDADGNPSAGGAFRMVALVVPAMNPETEEAAPFVTRIYGPHDDPGPYSNSVKAEVRRESIIGGKDLETGAGSEKWQVTDGSGGSLDFGIEYQRAIPERVVAEMKPHSAVDANFYRIYRYDETRDIINSKPASIDRVSNYHLSVSMQELAEAFDGTEELVGIALIPSYSRQTFLP